MARAMSTALAAHLAGAGTTTCHLLKITPVVSGVAAFGLTSAQADVVYDDGTGSLTYRSAFGYTPFDIISKPDLSIDTNQAEGLIAQYPMDGVTSAGIASGNYDGAAFVQYLVNYQDLTMGHVILNSGYVGQVTQTDELSCQIELRSLTQALKQNNIIELTSITCRAQFGDARCKMPLRFYASTVTAQTYKSNVLKDSPVLYWRLDETTGTVAADSSGKSHPGTYYTDASALTAAGLLRTSSDLGILAPAGFAGVTSAAGVAVTNADWTMELWVNLTSLPESAADLVTLGTTVGCPELGYVAATSDRYQLRVDVSGMSQLFLSAAVLAYGATHHLALSYDAATGALSLYIDGTLDSTGTYTYAAFTGVTVLGYASQYLGYAAAGSLDEFAIYQSALSSARIAAHYAAATVGAEPDRVFTFADIPGTSSAPGSSTGTVSVNPFFTGDGTTTVAQLLDTAGDVVTSGFSVAQIYRDGTLLVVNTDYTVSSTGLVSWIHGGTPYAPITGSVASWNGTITVWPDGFFAPGVVHWTSGANAGRECDVESYASSTGTLTLAIPAGQDIAVGDAFTIRRDCPKSKTACIAYGNLPNMRAEPELPRANGLDLQAPSSIG